MLATLTAFKNLKIGDIIYCEGKPSEIIELNLHPLFFTATFENGKKRIQAFVENEPLSIYVYTNSKVTR